MKSRRELQAEQTRRDILTAARRLFGSKGYKATRIADIAAEANVSPQTIYDSIGSKSAIVAGLMDGIEAEVGIHEVIPRIMGGTDPVEVLHAQLDLTRRFVTATGDLQRTVNSGGEPELVAVREEGRRRHRFGCGMTIERLAALGALAPDADLDRLGDTLAAVSDLEFVLTLIDHYGWSLDDALAMIGRILEREILGH